MAWKWTNCKIHWKMIAIPFWAKFHHLWMFSKAVFQCKSFENNFYKSRVGYLPVILGCAQWLKFLEKFVNSDLSLFYDVGLGPDYKNVKIGAHEFGGKRVLREDLIPPGHFRNIFQNCTYQSEMPDNCLITPWH